MTTLYTRYPIVARRAWPTGRVRRASKGILHTNDYGIYVRPQNAGGILGVATSLC